MSSLASADNLDDHQQFVLMKFRRAVADIRQPNHDNKFLLRWLRARNWNCDEAEKMLRASMKWRQKWQADDIVDHWKMPEVIATCRPCGTSGFDKDGCPVIIVPFGGIDIVGFISSCNRQDLMKTVLYILELNLRMAQKNDQHKLTVIFDMEGFNVTDYLWKPALSLVINLIQFYEANYPETLKTCYIINAPTLFSIVYNIIKKFINECTLKKIVIFKNDPIKWKKAILENVEPDNLPQHYGGALCDPDGNPKYTTVIKQGSKVPKHLYKKNIEENLPEKDSKYSTVIINKGEKFTLDFIVDEEGSLLRWDFRTEDNDIGFEILLKGEPDPVLPLERIDAHLVEASGVLECRAPATYSVIFDNSYSFIMSKKLHYHVYVMPTLNISTIEDNDEDITTHL